MLVIMGGPMGTYEEDTYPWLKDEKLFVRKAIHSDKAVLGICLGSQIIANALGAAVYPNKEKEIGWLPISFIDKASQDLFGSETVSPIVFQWHGDTFDLPENATLLASSDLYPNQAFTLGKNILALQFHVEVAADSLEKWLIGHTCELRHANIDITALRADNQQYASALEQVSGKIIQQYLMQLEAK